MTKEGQFTRNPGWITIFTKVRGNKRNEGREDGQVLQLVGDCDLPTTETCNGKWMKIADKKLVDLNVILVPKPTYPEYYEVRAEGAIQEILHPLLGFYKKQEDLAGLVYKKTDYTFVLYFDPSGHWTIDTDLLEGGCLVLNHII